MLEDEKDGTCSLRRLEETEALLLIFPNRRVDEALSKEYCGEFAGHRADSKVGHGVKAKRHHVRIKDSNQKTSLGRLYC